MSNGRCHHCGKEDKPVFPYTVPAGKFDMCSLCGNMLLRFHKHMGWESPENDPEVTKSEKSEFPITSDPLYVDAENVDAEKTEIYLDVSDPVQPFKSIKKPGFNAEKLKARLNRG